MNILIAIESCVEHRGRVGAQFDTWAPIQVSGFSWWIVPLEGNTIGMGVPDDYQHLPEKTKAICKYAIEWNVDFLFKVDTDTYVNIPRLLSSGFENYDYSGHVLDWLEFPYCAGPAYWLSRKAMELVASADLSKYRHPSYPDAEDVMVGMVLREHGISPHHDPRYALHADVLPDNDIISSHLSTCHGAYKTEMMFEAHKRFLDR